MKIRQIDITEASSLIKDKVTVYAISKTSKVKSLVKFENLTMKNVDDYIYFVLVEEI